MQESKCILHCYVAISSLCYVPRGQTLSDSIRENYNQLCAEFKQAKKIQPAP